VPPPAVATGYSGIAGPTTARTHHAPRHMQTYKVDLINEGADLAEPGQVIGRGFYIEARGLIHAAMLAAQQCRQGEAVELITPWNR